MRISSGSSTPLPLFFFLTLMSLQTLVLNSRNFATAAATAKSSSSSSAAAAAAAAFSFFREGRAVLRREISTVGPRSGQPGLAASRSVTSRATTSGIRMSDTGNGETADHPPPPHPVLIDVDCNLWHEDLKSPVRKDGGESGSDVDPIGALLREDAVEESNIVAVLSPSSTLAESKRGLAILSGHVGGGSDSCWPIRRCRTTVGVHPYHVLDDDVKGMTLSQVDEAIRQLVADDDASSAAALPPENTTDGDDDNRRSKKIASRGHVAAIGECGLDASEGFPPLEDQIPMFELQVKLARDLSLPLFVHERLAFEPCMKILECIHEGEEGEVGTAVATSRQSPPPVIIHCFTGTLEQCRAYIERGYYVSISGYLFREDSGDEKGSEVGACLENGLVPLDKLMIETDAPYMGFPGCRRAFLDKNCDYVNSLNSKKRKRLTNSFYPNLPSSLPQVLDGVLEHINRGRCDRGEQPLLTRNELALITTHNANEFFRFGLDLQR